MTSLQASINNRTIFCGDNLDVLRGFNDNCIDLIYLDPPFNKKKQFSAPIGSTSEGASFKDYWTMDDLKKGWFLELKENHEDLYQFINLSEYIGDKSNKYYLMYMAMRLLEMKRILKDTGSIYLHCDQTMSHFLKLLMDCIFGENNFRNEIIWHYRRWTGKAKSFQKLHDIIFYYSKTNNYFFNPIYTNYTEGSKERKEQGILNRFKDGEKVLVSNKEINNQGVRENDVWQIPFIAPSSKERTGYPTQKPVALLERIIRSSCPEEGVVLDPFCGCATTCVASERLGRKWIGIDISKMAFTLVKDRIKKNIDSGVIGLLEVPQIDYREDIPLRTDVETIKLQGKHKAELKQKLYGKQKGICNGCEQLHVYNFMEIDHIIPKSKGGQDNEDNLQLLCGYCNKSKGDRAMEYLISKYEDIV